MALNRFVHRGDKKSKPKLTDEDWRKIFDIRCRSKRGQQITQDELKLCERALHEDADRYSAMNQRVFEATKPFGSKGTP